jgi:hypothetical protein
MTKDDDPFSRAATRVGSSALYGLCDVGTINCALRDLSPRVADQLTDLAASFAAEETSRVPLDRLPAIDTRSASKLPRQGTPAWAH